MQCDRAIPLGFQMPVQARALLLDLDDTLLDWSGRRRALEVVGAEWAPILQTTSTRLLSVYESARVSGLELAESLVWRGVLSGEAVENNVWHQTLVSVGVPFLEASTVARRIRIRQRTLELKFYVFYRDALELLEEAARSRFPVAVVTNGSVDLQMAKLELAPRPIRPRTVIVSAALGSAKPEPEIFVAACAAISVPTTAAVHVGDSLRTDVAGARRAGVFAVWLNRSGRAVGPDRPRPDAEIASLSEVSAALRSHTSSRDKGTLGLAAQSWPRRL